MEQDRYAQNHTLYIIGMLSLVLSMALLGFSIYILPYLVLDWVYNVPDFIVAWREDISDSYAMTDAMAGWMLFLAFFVPALIAGLITYIASNQIENTVLEIKTHSESSERIQREARETASILSKIIIIVLLVFAAVAFFEWILYVPPKR